ncbi:hypothetical protein J6590_057554 [Homalodisca vitripennis]|nr:hypothetical protein J6590_057554 [Homalodisca vitripennis]
MLLSGKAILRTPIAADPAGQMRWASRSVRQDRQQVSARGSRTARRLLALNTRPRDLPPPVYFSFYSCPFTVLLRAAAQPPGLLPRRTPHS